MLNAAAAGHWPAGNKQDSSAVWESGQSSSSDLLIYIFKIYSFLFLSLPSYYNM